MEGEGLLVAGGGALMWNFAVFGYLIKLPGDWLPFVHPRPLPINIGKTRESCIVQLSMHINEIKFIDSHSDSNLISN